MHNYKPSQNVRILTIRVAVPEETPFNALADFFSGLLEGTLAREHNLEDPILLDWEHTKPAFIDCPVIKVGDMPKEGSAFMRLDTSRQARAIDEGGKSC